MLHRYLFTLLVGSAAMAQNVGPIITTALIGVAGQQSARLNATRPDLPVPALTAAICSASLAIRGENGQILKSQNFGLVGPGQTVSITLNSATDIPAPSPRTEVRGTISPDPDAQSPPLCELAVSLEIYDNDTGKTTAVVEGTTPSLGWTVEPAARTARR